MKAIVFLALIALSQAAHQFYYAGTTNSTSGGASPQANYAIVDSNGVCTASTVASGYQLFTINATANTGSAFYWVTALFERVSLVSGQIQVYNGRYTPATPCGNLTIVGDGSNRAPHSSVLVYLPPGLHDVVVTTTDPTDAGVFSAHADRSAGPVLSQGTTTSSPYMLQQYTSYDTCTSYSSGAPYVYFQWTAATTGYIDIIGFSYNSTITSNSWVASLYNTSAAQLPFIGTGNATNPADGCVNAYWVDNFDEETSFSKVSQSYFSAGVLIGVHVTAGQNFTLVMSGYYTTDNYIFGYMTRPTVQGYLGSNPNFYRPSFGSTQAGDTCTNGTSGFNWYPIIITAAYTTYVVDNGASYSGIDTAACLYYGNNAGSADQTVAPVTCSANWLQCIDTGDIGPLHQLGTVVGQNYTIVQTTYSSGAGTGVDFALYVYTGAQLGPLPITTTGAPIVTTADMTTGGAAEGSGSSASMIVASLSLILAALLF